MSSCNLIPHHFRSQQQKKYLAEKMSHTLRGRVLPQPFYKQALVFMCLLYKSFENTVGKRRICSQ